MLKCEKYKFYNIFDINVFIGKFIKIKNDI